MWKVAVRIEAATATIAFLVPVRDLRQWNWAQRQEFLVRMAAHAH
jgi:hypothetical protein